MKALPVVAEKAGTGGDVAEKAGTSGDVDAEKAGTGGDVAEKAGTVGDVDAGVDKAVADNAGTGGGLDSDVDNAAAEKAGTKSILEKAKEGLGATFIQTCETVVNEALEMLGPKVGELAFQQMSEKYTVVKMMKSAKQKAIDAAAEAFKSLNQPIMDFLQKVVSEPNETLKKVGEIMFKGCKDATDQSVRAILNATSCACCIKLCVNEQTIVDNVSPVAQQTLKGFFKDSLKKKGVPSMIIDKVRWGNEDDKVGEPTEKAPPQQEEMPTEKAPPQQEEKPTEKEPPQQLEMI